MSTNANGKSTARRLETLLRGELRRARRAHWLAALGRKIEMKS